MDILELIRLFYKLRGIGWNSRQRIATFTTAQAADEFKGVAPHWQVKYRKKGPE